MTIPANDPLARVADALEAAAVALRGPRPAALPERHVTIETQPDGTMRAFEHGPRGEGYREVDIPERAAR